MIKYGLCISWPSVSPPRIVLVLLVGLKLKIIKICSLMLFANLVKRIPLSAPQKNCCSAQTQDTLSSACPNPMMFPSSYEPQLSFTTPWASSLPATRRIFHGVGIDCVLQQKGSMINQCARVAVRRICPFTVSCGVEDINSQGLR